MKLAIYCAGGLGKEVYDLAVRNNENRWKEIFFVDDMRQEKIFYGVRIAKFEQLKESGDVEFVIANGEPFVRQILRERVIKAGFRLTRIIDKTATISHSARIADGVIIQAGCFVSSDVAIGENTYLQQINTIGHDCIIGPNCVISSLCQVSGNCVIGDNVYIGVGSSVREKVSVGQGSIIGMGSFVHKDVGELSVAYGNPAKIIRTNESKRVFQGGI